MVSNLQFNLVCTKIGTVQGATFGTRVLANCNLIRMSINSNEKKEKNHISTYYIIILLYVVECPIYSEGISTSPALMASMVT